jgi:DUF4097 and DUF4098 domain-containing protein YvlB
MKKNFLITIAGLLVFTLPILAQNYKVSVDNPKDAKLVLSSFSGDLNIEGYTGNEVIITSSTLDEMKPPERAKGLTPVYSGGTDNTGVGLSVTKDGNTVVIHCLIPFNRGGDYQLKVPESMALQITSECQNNNNISITGTKGEIEINNCYDINLKNVSGPLVLATISGNIDIVFGTIATGKPFSISSVSGEVDVTLPAGFAADINMSSVTGGMYSDFDFSNKADNLKKVGGNQLNYKLNGGGTDFNVVSVSGNIYLRKGK